MIYPGCLALILICSLLLLMPFFFVHAMLAALAKLGLSPPLAFVILIGIVIGSSVNIPIRRFPRNDLRKNRAHYIAIPPSTFST